MTALEDDSPPRFEVNYTAERGASVSGKLPAGVTPADIARALGIADVTGSPVLGNVEGSDPTDALTALSSWLPEMDALRFDSDAGIVVVDAIAAPGVDLDLLRSGLFDALGDRAKVKTAALTTLPDDGASRVNQSTGQTETFTNGFWLPVLDFVADADICAAQAADALSRDKVNFLSGSAQLDAQSIRTINNIAAVIGKCVRETDLSVEIGGHTDSLGGEEANQELSQLRAEAVRTALIDRGVADSAITARGYGETEPIAYNETEEGRAANRRTTVTWFAPTTATKEQTKSNTSAGE